MTHIFSTYLVYVQTAASLASMCGILLAVWQFRRQIATTRMNFVLQAEAQIDPLWVQLFNQRGDVIRKIYSDALPAEWTDEELKAFVFMGRRFTHISRMIYLLKDGDSNTGMSESLKKAYVAPWIESLRQYKDNPYMRHYYLYVVSKNMHNTHMMAIAKSVFGDIGSQPPLS